MPNQTEQNPPTKCPKCGMPLSQKSGKYGKFLGCTAYPDCRYIWRPESATEKRHKEVMNAIRIINDNIKSLHKKVDQLIQEKL